MFCPKCKSEYVGDVKRCADCDTELVETLLEDEGVKEEFEYVEFVTIAATNNYFIMPIAKSILDSVGIKYFMKGEGLRFMPGIIGPVEIQVPMCDAEVAKELLKDIDL